MATYKQYNGERNSPVESRFTGQSTLDLAITAATDASNKSIKADIDRRNIHRAAEDADNADIKRWDAIARSGQSAVTNVYDVKRTREYQKKMRDITEQQAMHDAIGDTANLGESHLEAGHFDEHSMEKFDQDMRDSMDEILGAYEDMPALKDQAALKLANMRVDMLAKKTQRDFNASNARFNNDLTRMSNDQILSDTTISQVLSRDTVQGDNNVDEGLLAHVERMLERGIITADNVELLKDLSLKAHTSQAKQSLIRTYHELKNTLMQQKASERASKATKAHEDRVTALKIDMADRERLNTASGTLWDNTSSDMFEDRINALRHVDPKGYLAVRKLLNRHEAASVEALRNPAVQSMNDAKEAEVIVLANLAELTAKDSSIKQLSGENFKSYAQAIELGADVYSEDFKQAVKSYEYLAGVKGVKDWAAIRLPDSGSFQKERADGLSGLSKTPAGARVAITNMSPKELKKLKARVMPDGVPVVNVSGSIDNWAAISAMPEQIKDVSVSAAVRTGDPEYTAYILNRRSDFNASVSNMPNPKAAQKTIEALADHLVTGAAYSHMNRYEILEYVREGLQNGGNDGAALIGVPKKALMEAFDDAMENDEFTKGFHLPNPTSYVSQTSDAEGNTTREYKVSLTHATELQWAGDHLSNDTEVLASALGVVSDDGETYVPYDLLGTEKRVRSRSMMPLEQNYIVTDRNVYPESGMLSFKAKERKTGRVLSFMLAPYYDDQGNTIGYSPMDADGDTIYSIENEIAKDHAEQHLIRKRNRTVGGA